MAETSTVCSPASRADALASRGGHRFTTEVLPVADLCMDFHTGGADRFNAAQVRGWYPTMST
ncbi:MAG: hypothetical protein IPI05_05300 [Flavobacteriales bacterium]|nr:hypothetical protein [Flavobacteriales bacterium]